DAVPVSVRLNPNKKSVCNDAEKIPWCKDGVYLTERPRFTADPLFHAGTYYVQEASSMFTGYVFGHFFEQKSRLRVLDLCAAPGGKSTHISSMLPNDSLLVSNEVIQSRAGILAEN